jgi:hypothetical protein
MPIGLAKSKYGAACLENIKNISSENGTFGGLVGAVFGIFKFNRKE